MAYECLNYPFDIKEILRKQRSLRKSLLEQDGLAEVRVAILGGSTTAETKNLAELFLLKSGIRPVFHESEYNKYFEDAVVDDSALREFKPDIAYIHTSQVNLLHAPRLFAPEEHVDQSLERELARYRAIWERLTGDLKCMVIQNNFDLPPVRSLGGLDSTEAFGRSNFIGRLNLAFAEAARRNPKLVINDIHHLSARIGLDQWFDREYWFSYKMAVAPAANVHLAHQVAKLVRAILGRTRKCLVLDLDNTLWGGVIGDDGVDRIVLGQESARGEAFTAFQQHCAQLAERGILLAVASKNEEANARQGFSHRDMVLKLDQIAAFKANWDPKPGNIAAIAKELNIGVDSLAFIDDNPAERALVSGQLQSVAVPDAGEDVGRFAEFLDREGYFEVCRLTRDDAERGRFYSENKVRAELESKFADYGDFLSSLDMKAEIGAFAPPYLDRIAQLTNKTNQFNLTTKRCTLAEIEAMASDPDYITLYGRLADRFGDNGLVTVVSGRIAGDSLEIDLWLMSCRVLKRDMENAMLDALIERARERGVTRIVGSYLPTAKNAMVADHYGKLGFTRLLDSGGTEGTIWSLDISAGYERRNRHLKEITYV
jgi:FkbH-like protein